MSGCVVYVHVSDPTTNIAPIPDGSRTSGARSPGDSPVPIRPEAQATAEATSRLGSGARQGGCELLCDALTILVSQAGCGLAGRDWRRITSAKSERHFKSRESEIARENEDSVVM
jgi:hypothetical protein